jgi:hypothetical protein
MAWASIGQAVLGRFGAATAPATDFRHGNWLLDRNLERDNRHGHLYIFMPFIISS